jgi:hypothetical protein
LLQSSAADDPACAPGATKISESGRNRLVDIACFFGIFSWFSAPLCLLTQCEETDVKLSICSSPSYQKEMLMPHCGHGRDGSFLTRVADSEV